MFYNPFLCSRQGRKEKSLGKDYPEERKRLFWGSSWNTIKNIINFTILCVFHLTAGRRWKRSAKPCIPSQLQEKWKAVCVLYHQPRTMGYRASWPHSSSCGIHSIQVSLKCLRTYFSILFSHFLFLTILEVKVTVIRPQSPPCWKPRVCP